MAAVLGTHLKQVLPFVINLSFGNGVCRMSHKDIAQSAFARTVGAHDGMYLARLHGKVYSFQYLLAVNRGMEVLNL